MCRRLSSTKVEPRYRRAIFKGLLIQADLRSWIARLGFPPRQPVPVKNVDHDEQQTVLVDVVESMQLPKRVPFKLMRFGELPAVRLAFFKRVQNLPAFDLRYEIGADELAIPIEGRRSNGKLSLFPRRSPVKKNKLPSKMIQSRSEGIKDLSSNKAPLPVDHREIMHAVDLLRTLPVTLDADAVSIGIDLGLDRPLDVGKMCFSSPELELHTRQIQRHDHEPTPITPQPPRLVPNSTRPPSRGCPSNCVGGV